MKPTTLWTLIVGGLASIDQDHEGRMDELLKRAMPAKSNIEKVLSATAEMGAASALEVAVQVMRALAQDAVRGKVEASEIRAAALSLERSAEKKRAAAKAVLDKH